MQSGFRVLYIALVLLSVVAGDAAALGTAPKRDELIVSHPRELALITALSGPPEAETRPPGLTLQGLYDHAAARLSAAGIKPYSIRGDGCEPVDGRTAWFKEPCDVYLEVEVALRPKGVFIVTLRFHRNLEFTSGDKPYYINAITWFTDGAGEHGGHALPVLGVVDTLIDSFLKLYTLANNLSGTDQAPGKR